MKRSVVPDERKINHLQCIQPVAFEKNSTNSNPTLNQLALSSSRTLMRVVSVDDDASRT